MKKRTSFIKLIQLWGIICLIGISVCFTAIDIFDTYRHFNWDVEHMRADHITTQKQMIKQEVHHVVDMIAHIKAQSETLTRKKIKSRVYEAYSIAQNIYQKYKTAKSKHEIQQMIIAALRPIRFEQESGYYFISRSDGVAQLFPSNAKLEGLNLLGVQDAHEQYITKDMIKIIKQSGEGFYQYHWTKPDATGNDHQKISFIKLFEPYNLHFARPDMIFRV